MSYYAPCHSFTSRIITGATLNHNIICPHTAVIICRLLYPCPEITWSWSGDSEILYSISGGFSPHENYFKTQCLIFISVGISLSQSEISSSKGSFWRLGFQLNSDWSGRLSVESRASIKTRSQVFFSLLNTPLFLVFLYTLHQSLLGITCATLTLSLSLSLSLSQIYLSWKSGPAEVKHWKDMMGRPRTAVSQWHALKAWGSQRTTCPRCFFFLSSEFSIRLSTPTHPLLRYNRGLGRQIMCVISLFSGLFDILCPQSSWHHP